MVSMSDDKSKGYRFGSHLWCIAAANHIRALLQLCYTGLPQVVDCHRYFTWIAWRLPVSSGLKFKKQSD